MFNLITETELYIVCDIGKGALAILREWQRELEEKLKASGDELKTCKHEVARLRKNNKRLTAAWDKAEKALDIEITIGDKFLESEVGKKRLKEAKNSGVDEFKKSEAFHSEMFDAASGIFDEAMMLCRERLPGGSESGFPVNSSRCRLVGLRQAQLEVLSYCSAEEAGVLRIHMFLLSFAVSKFSFLLLNLIFGFLDLAGQ
ncbi:hypothetical protein Salat_1556300 [Sesamum alatum]|uniref:Uncharacterized protein n=1 Tax=Sesamum alatum TaxID=300844 RepID=A0AAE1YE27_9LAMI|nr:hypothetical protein Salat_1556300 [Sesamum alatum]